MAYLLPGDQSKNEAFVHCL